MRQAVYGSTLIALVHLVFWYFGIRLSAIAELGVAPVLFVLGRIFAEPAADNINRGTVSYLVACGLLLLFLPFSFNVVIIAIVVSAGTMVIVYYRQKENGNAK